jgi:CRP-like cAMP-binding protein
VSTEPAAAHFYIQEGKVKVCVTSDLGKEAVVALHGKGDFFGEGCLTGQPLRLATAKAMAASEVMRVDKAEMNRAPKARNVMAFARIVSPNTSALIIDAALSALRITLLTGTRAAGPGYYIYRLRRLERKTYQQWKSE